MSSTDSTFLVAEERDGKPVMNGRRQVVEGVDDAIDTALEINGRAYALEPVEQNAHPPRPAVTHVASVLDSNAAVSDFYAAIPNPHTSMPEADDE